MRKLIKILPIVLVLAMLLSMGLAYADNGGQSDKRRAATTEETSNRDDDKDKSVDNKDDKSQRSDRREQRREFINKTKELRGDLQAKRQEIRNAQKANRSLVQQIRERIEQLREVGASNLTDEQIAALKEASELLKGHAKGAKDTVKGNRGLWQSYRVCIRDKDFDGAEGTMGEMLASYDTVLSQIKEIGDALAALLTALV